MALVQLVYYSRNKIDGSLSELISEMRGILATSVRRNMADGITGYLLFDRNWFLQILEGEKSTVMKTYERIAGDNRHSELAICGEIKPIRYRTFSQWAMAACARTADKQELFLRYGIGSVLDPSKLNAATIVQLCEELASAEKMEQPARMRATG